MFVAETYRYGSSTLDIRGYMWMLEDELANRNQEDFLATVRRSFGEEGLKELSKESEVVRLLEDTNGDGVADKTSVYADNFRSPLDGVAAGVLARRGQVWFTNIPALWRFTGRDKAETRDELLRGFGVRFNFTGHDLHGLIWGPDGRIYFSCGDRGSSVPTKEGSRVESPDTGSVFRCYPDGSGLELFATGLRNPQSLLFNEYGDLFTGDNDSDQGDEERLVHLVQDGDSGWRVGYQFAPRGKAGPWNEERLWYPRHPSQPAYLLAPICNIEDGPSGIAYYPGTGLTPDYAGKIFITHFKGTIARSGIYTYGLHQVGASYTIASAEPFLTSALPTDIRFGPDGKLYYSDWAEGWPKSKRGRIYAMFDPKHANDPLTRSTQQLIASDYTRKSVDELRGLLAHPDWRVRLEAQYTLAERGAASIPVFSDVMAKNENELARRHAVWGLGQLAVKFPGATKVLRTGLNHHDGEVRAQSAKLLGELRDQESAAALVSLLGGNSLRVKFFAAQALGKLKHAPAVPALLAEVRTNADVDAYLRHALVMGLAGCATPEQLAATTTDASRSVRLAAVLALRRQASPEVAKFLADADPLIMREAATAINDAPIVAAYPALAAFVAKPVASQAVMLRALNAHFRLGTPADAVALADYAARADAPEALRTEALTLLSEWPKPPARDRIVGIYRPLPDKTRAPEVAANAMAPHLGGWFIPGTPDSVKEAALEAIKAVDATAAIPKMRALVDDESQSAETRAAALEILDQLKDPALNDTVTVALASNSPALRLAALPIATRLTPDKVAAPLRRLATEGTDAEKQAAFAALGKLKLPEADTILAEQVRQLDAGKVTPAVRLELLEAAALRSDPAVKQALADHDAAIAASKDPLAPYLMSLEGGNKIKGRKLFNEHPVLQCLRCHRDGHEWGGDAGPDLAGVGTSHPREYVLESIVLPNAKIAAGFDTIVVTKKNGEIAAGVVTTEDAESVSLRDIDSKIVTVKKSDIKSRDAAPSPMPAVFGTVLTRRELRDLVAYVYSLKEKSTVPESLSVQPRALRPAPTD
jgi:quinoprotein glucose dehydrogenase